MGIHAAVTGYINRTSSLVLGFSLGWPLVCVRMQRSIETCTDVGGGNPFHGLLA